MDFLFPGFKTKALTFSYDDNTTQDRRLTDIFRKYGLKATFNINTGSFGQHAHLDSHGGFYCEYNRIDETEVSTLYNGFEVASHTVDHAILTEIDDSSFDYQITEDCKRIERLCGEYPAGLAYPCGRYNNGVAEHLKSLGIRYARTVDDTHSFKIPENFLIWHPTCHDHDKNINLLIDEFLKDNGDALKLFYIWGHSFELDKPDTDRWADMEHICGRLSGHDEIWYAENREICDYVSAVRNIKPGDTVNNTEKDLYIKKDNRDIIWKIGTDFNRL